MRNIFKPIWPQAKRILILKYNMDYMKRRKIIGLILLIVAAVLSTFFLVPESPKPTEVNPSATAPAEEKINVTFKIVAPEKTQELTVAVSPKSTVYDAMEVLNQEKKLVVVFKTFAGMGAMVETIDGVANDTAANKFWLYYINGQSAQVGISSYVLQPKDVIEWKYEVSQF